ncbi:hypothetical protein Stube_38150 [Streptomyces tubercidicus]|uniref:Uncharacterized protein n=1 Tax=Streptomyces tubercidicus TaxID=47759 RepID=A0A640UUX2_9ACTN|nr:hypothetical protein Stube_38150 [Streptomyces tubercidicus]
MRSCRVRSAVRAVSATFAKPPAMKKMKTHQNQSTACRLPTRAFGAASQGKTSGRAPGRVRREDS